MTKFEDNLSPYTSYVESSAPSSPSAGNQRVYIDSADHLLKRKNSSGTVTMIESSGLLAYKANTSGDYSPASATMADVDATNMAVTFTAPASTNVLVRLSATCSADHNSASSYQSWGLRESTSNIAGAVGESIAIRDGSAGTDTFIGASKVFVLTGISAGSHTYKWAYAQSAGTGTLKANSNSQAVMEVWALP